MNFKEPERGQILTINPTLPIIKAIPEGISSTGISEVNGRVQNVLYEASHEELNRAHKVANDDTVKNVLATTPETFEDLNISEPVCSQQKNVRNLIAKSLEAWKIWYNEKTSK